MRTLPFVLVVALAACGGKSTPATGPDDGTGSAAPSAPSEPAGSASAGGACIKTGCSGTVCTEPGNEVMTTCEFKPEYACYRTATCERQADGKCGWTQTAELTACLQNPPPIE